MTVRLHVLALTLAPTLLIAGCGETKAPAGKGQAAGEILPGSVSDAMVPLDTVRSQAPLAPRAGGDGEGADAKGPVPARPAARRDKPSKPAAAPEAPAGGEDEVMPNAE
jgi:hypothetical protein